MKRYNIAAFCRMLGVSADTLRYYEREKLLCTARNPENRYRTYTKEDALDVWNLFMLRSLDMGLQDMAQLRGQGSFEAQSEFLHEQERILEQEIIRLRMRKYRIRQLSVLYDLASDVGKPQLRKAMQGHYAVYIFNGQDIAENNKESPMPSWVSGMPFTYIALSISYENLIAQPHTFPVRIGLGVLEENIKKTSCDLRKSAEYVPPIGENLCFAFVVRNVFEIGREDLLPLYLEAETRRLHITGPASGRIICSSCRARNPEYLIALSVPVEASC